MAAVATLTSTDHWPRRLLSGASVHAFHQLSQVFITNDASDWMVAPLHAVCCALASSHRRLASFFVALLGIAQCTVAFPRTATHLYLGVVISLLLALLDGD